MNNKPKKFKETKLRTIIKSLLLRVIVFLLITIIVFLIGGTWEEGIGVALLDIGIELVTYYFYERIWQNISWGIVEKMPNDPDKTLYTINPIIEELPISKKDEIKNDIEIT